MLINLTTKQKCNTTHLKRISFDIIHNVGKVNQDVYGLDQNLSYNEEDIIGVHLYGDVILKAI
jgi:hypothetical protein